MNRLHPADLADLIESLPERKRTPVWKLIKNQLKGEILLEADGEVEKQLIDASSDQELIEAVKDLQVDELVDLKKILPKKVVDNVIHLMDKDKRERYKKALQYPPDSAGGLMDIDAISIKKNLTLRGPRDFPSKKDKNRCSPLFKRSPRGVYFSH